MHKDALFNANSSSIKNPLSARILSPYPTKSKKPDLFVISLSEILPPQPCDRNVIVSAGLTPNSICAFIIQPGDCLSF